MAKKVPDPPRFVIVIDREPIVRGLADSAPATLLGVHLIIVLNGHPVFISKPIPPVSLRGRSATIAGSDRHALWLPIRSDADGNWPAYCADSSFSLRANFGQKVTESGY